MPCRDNLCHVGSRLVIIAEPTAIFDPIFDSEDRRWGFFVFKPEKRRKKEVWGSSKNTLRRRRDCSKKGGSSSKKMGSSNNLPLLFSFFEAEDRRPPHHRSSKPKIETSPIFNFRSSGPKVEEPRHLRFSAPKNGRTSDENRKAVGGTSSSENRICFRRGRSNIKYRFSIFDCET